MNPILVTYIGFVVAALIIMWAVIELTRRYTRQRKVTTQVRDTWLTVKPMTPRVTTENPTIHEEDEAEDIINAELQKRSKQNGHHSPSKNM